MENINVKFIINIGRQVGSGGIEIGKMLADSFHIAFYDKSLLELAAKETGLDAKYFEKADEKPTNKFLFALANNDTNVNYENFLSRDELFKFQANVIRRIASEKSCVIVGRTSDYILRDFDNCFNFFIHAPMDKRVEEIMKQENMSENNAIHLINKVDKKRANYYNYYTNKIWGNASSYHLSVDSSLLGWKGTAELLKKIIETKLLITK